MMFISNIEQDSTTLMAYFLNEEGQVVDRSSSRYQHLRVYLLKLHTDRDMLSRKDA